MDLLLTKSEKIGFSMLGYVNTAGDPAIKKKLQPRWRAALT